MNHFTFPFSRQRTRIIQLSGELFCLLQTPSSGDNSVLEWLCFCIMYLTVHLRSHKTMPVLRNYLFPRTELKEHNSESLQQFIIGPAATELCSIHSFDF